MEVNQKEDLSVIDETQRSLELHVNFVSQWRRRGHRFSRSLHLSAFRAGGVSRFLTSYVSPDLSFKRFPFFPSFSFLFFLYPPPPPSPRMPLSFHSFSPSTPTLPPFHLVAVMCAVQAQVVYHAAAAATHERCGRYLIGLTIIGTSVAKTLKPIYRIAITRISVARLSA